jgi:hypothetical protein
VVENSDEILDAVNSFMRGQRAPPESDSNTTFQPRRPYNLLQSGGRIENAGAEQNGNENRLQRNVNSFDPTKYKTTICKVLNLLLKMGMEFIFIQKSIFKLYNI